jgi:hypothetical protein
MEWIRGTRAAMDRKETVDLVVAAAIALAASYPA